MPRVRKRCGHRELHDVVTDFIDQTGPRGRLVCDIDRVEKCDPMLSHAVRSEEHTSELQSLI